MSKNLKRAFAALLASLGIFAFAGCGTTENGSGNNEGGSGGNQTEGEGSGSGNGGSNTGNEGSGSGNGNGNGGNQGGGGTQTPVLPPVIENKPISGAVKIIESSGHLESAYVEWEAAENAAWYNVYYKGASGDYVKLDAPLVRQYENYYRADAVGLKAGAYSMKVVPVDGAGVESERYSASASNITVIPHTREGYAFTGGNVPGAYNLDGTLKSGAQVIYVTAANAKTIKTTVYKAGKPIEATGFQSIIDARQASKEADMDNTPLCFRIVGTVNKDDLDHISSAKEGLQIKGTKNITIEGIGSDGTVNGFGFLIRNCKNVELRNFGVVNFMDDGISLDTGNSNIWVHNLDIFYGSAGGDKDQAKGDGSLDSKGTDYSTYSYNHFWDSGKSNLLGNGNSESSGEGGATHLSYHHNWYDHSDSRHPRIRIATVHVYNNYFDGNSKYGVGVTMGASAFVENNYYRSTATMKPMMSSLQGTDIAHGKDGQTFSGEAGGMIKAYGNAFDGKYELLTQKNTDPDNIDCYEAATRDEQVPSTYKTKSGATTYNNFDTASDFYTYTPDTAEQAKANVEKYAGRVGGGDLQWDFDDATEDSNYSIIPGLKAAVTGYKSKVIKIGNVEVSGGSTGGETGGDSGNTGGTAPIEGEIKFIPTASGNGFTVTGSTYSNSAITVDGVEIAKGASLKLDSDGSVTFTTTKAMTLYLYVYNAETVKVDDANKTPVSEGNCYVISMPLATGTHVIAKGGKQNALYLIKLVPVS